MIQKRLIFYFSADRLVLLKYAARTDLLAKNLEEALGYAFYNGIFCP